MLLFRDDFLDPVERVPGPCVEIRFSRGVVVVRGGG